MNQPKPPTKHTLKILSILVDYNKPVIANAVAIRLYPDAPSSRKTDKQGVRGLHRQLPRMVGGQLGKLEKKGLVENYYDYFSKTWLWRITPQGVDVLNAYKQIS